MSAPPDRGPWVVALLPAFDAAAFIEPTLRSLAAQTYPDLRVIVSIDASADDTAERCESFAAGDPRFSVIRQREPLGWIGNTNALLAMADGEFCFLAAHDDVLEPDYVTRLVAAARANPAAVLAFSDMETSYPDGRREIARFDALDGVTRPVDRARRLFADGAAWWVPYRGLVRVDAVRRAGGLRRHPAGEVAADGPFMLRLALLGEFARVPEVLYRKQYRSTSVSLGWRYGRRQRMSLLWSGAMAIARSPLGVKERMVLLGFLAGRGLGVLAGPRLARRARAVVTAGLVGPGATVRPRWRRSR